MPNISRLKVIWSGFQGGPGISTLYSTETTVFYPLFVNLWQSLRPYIAGGITLTIPAGGDIIDPLNGNLVGSWGGVGSNVLTATGAGSYAAPAGIRIKWGTGSIMDGHRLVGTTYLVPAPSSVFTSDGTVLDSVAATLNTILGNYVTSINGAQVVWHRPLALRAGGFSAVTSGAVVDKAVVMRTRRD